jgi:hypothetical protein
MNARKKNITKIPKTPFDDGLGESLREHFGTDGFNANLRSSHGPLVQMALAGPPTGGARQSADAHVTDKRLYHQGKERRIAAVLRSLKPIHGVALWLAYGPERWALEVYTKFPALGACAGVVLVCPEGQRAFELEWHARAAKGHDAAKLDVFVRRGLGEWLRGAPKAITDAVAASAAELLREARAAYSAASKSKRLSDKASKELVGRKARMEPLELRRRTTLDA